MTNLAIAYDEEFFDLPEDIEEENHQLDEIKKLKENIIALQNELSAKIVLETAQCRVVCNDLRSVIKEFNESTRKR